MAGLEEPRGSHSGLTSSSEKRAGGRPEINEFRKSSDRSKRRKTEDLRATCSSDELGYATQMKLRAEGKTDASVVVKNILTGSPSKGTKYRRSLESGDKSQVFTPQESLSLFVELGLSRNKYVDLRNALVDKGYKILSSKKRMYKARIECYPRAELSISETSAEIPLQHLLNHTAERILIYQKEVLNELSTEQLNNLVLICKWGCDGSSGHSIYKQRLEEKDASDAQILFLALVPLQLIHIDKKTEKVTWIWKNRRPSSPRFCRPIKMMNEKETPESVRQETDFIQKQIDALENYSTVIDGKRISVKYVLSLTMIDGKVCNSLTETASAQRCLVCGSTSKEFNNIDSMLKKDVEKDNLKFGISSLHAWIRFFEFILHLSYKLEIQKWQVRNPTPEVVAALAERKKAIKQGFKEKLFLNVDQPKPGGAGSTNDGNTARRAFENYEITAGITGIDEDLIYRLYIILQAISCGYDIDIPSFQKYAEETARKYVNLYKWYYMPTTVHKILLHGSEIIRSSMLPIGQMSEEAQESCNKFFKIYRERFARKNCRKKTMEDVFRRFLISSDPYISSCRKLRARPVKSLSKEVIPLLRAPSLTVEPFQNIISLLREEETDTESDSSGSTLDGIEDLSDQDGDFFL